MTREVWFENWGSCVAGSLFSSNVAAAASLYGKEGGRKLFEKKKGVLLEAKTRILKEEAIFDAVDPEEVLAADEQIAREHLRDSASGYVEIHGGEYRSYVRAMVGALEGMLAGTAIKADAHLVEIHFTDLSNKYVTARQLDRV